MSHPAPANWRASLLATLVAMLLYFLRFGYDYGQSDQDETIPYLLHRLDETLFQHDWFVQTQAQGIGVRTGFVWLLHGLALGLPPWGAVLVLHVLAWGSLGTAVFALARHLTRQTFPAVLAVLVVLVFTPQWTLGGNDLVHRMLVPTMVAWGVGLWGVVGFLRQREGVAGLLFGLATWVQALVGLHLGLAFGLVLVLDLLGAGILRPAARAIRPFGWFCGAFLAGALPGVGMLAWAQLVAPPIPASSDLPSLFYLLAAFRNPHHYLPSAFPLTTWIKFGVLLLGGLAVLATPSLRDRFAAPRLLAALLTLAAGVLLVAFVFTEGWPSLAVARLQLFALTVLLKPLLVILVVGTAVTVVPERYRDWLDRACSARSVLAGMVIVWIVVAGLLVADQPWLRSRVAPLDQSQSPIARVEAWAQANTPASAVFAVPPSVSSFRTFATRAIVVNFKSIPYEPSLLVEWFTRLRAFAPLTDLPELGGAPILPLLDAAYEGLAPEELLPLARSYAVDYVVRASPLPPHPAFEEVFAVPPMRVYQVVVPRPVVLQ
jgi:hypothetical protein